MIDIRKLSSHYQVRVMCDEDAHELLDFCMENTQYYQYCSKEPSLELILTDLHITPPGIEESAQYYVGFYENNMLVAIMDLIDGFPREEFCYIGFFMMNKKLQGKQIGTEIIKEVCRYLKKISFAAVRLGIDKGNPQSTHFWKKNGFVIIKEVVQEEGTILVAEKIL